VTLQIIPPAILTIVSKLRESLWYLSLTPFPNDTEDSRRRERYRLAALSIVANAISKAIGLAVLFISMRVALPYLGQARFGVWMTISSLAVVLTIFDFGISNGLVSRVAHLTATNHTDELRRLVGKGFLLLATIGMTIGFIFAVLAALMPLGWLFRHAPPELLQEARNSLILFGILFGCSVPLQAAQRIYAGLQLGYVAYLVVALFSLIGVVLIPFLPALNCGIPGFLLVTYGFQVASGAFLVFLLCVRRLVAAPVSYSFCDNETRSLLETGGLFFILQVGFVVGIGADTALISAYLGPIEVALFAVVQRMFLVVTAPLSILNSPLWAGYAAALGHGDTSYIRRTLRWSFTGTLGLAFLGAVVVVAARVPFSTLLTNGVLTPSFGLVLLFGFWSVMEATGGAFAQYLNGVGLVSPQVKIVSTFVLFPIASKLVLIESFGLLIVPIITISVYFLTHVIPYATFYRKSVFTIIYSDRK